ncbi:Protein kinase-like domain-containing protein [Aphelenchoides besseyi]|nr:Protein kinase-like domain-containing protein [Aphelenchoides besseyi]KAI6221597.1 Protein kinase-like domain-containing protein [Aphelenchoides besseyi]
MDATVEHEITECEQMNEETDQQERQLPLVVNGIPHFDSGYKFNDKFEIVERIGWDDGIGATYFVKSLIDPRALELVMRVDNFRDKATTLPLEINLIKAAEEENKHQLFAQLYGSGTFLHFGWYCTYYRGGPSLTQIVEFMRINRLTEAKFTASTVGRFAENLYQILDFVHQQGNVLCGLNTDMFHFDGASRTLFLSDLSTILREPTEQHAMNVKWKGSLQYTPVNWNNNKIPQRNLEVEAIGYMVLEFALGSLPWNLLSFDDCVAKMSEIKFVQSQKQIQLERFRYQNFFQMVKEISRANEPYESLSGVLEHCKIIYEQLGGCKDLDEDLDFERQPHDDELPRFVLERDDLESLKTAEELDTQTD